MSLSEEQHCQCSAMHPKGTAMHPRGTVPTLSYMDVYMYICIITSYLLHHVGSDEENLETIS